MILTAPAEAVARIEQRIAAMERFMSRDWIVVVLGTSHLEV